MADAAPRLFPYLRYRDAPAAIKFLESAFGFRHGVVLANEDGSIAHAELSYGPSILMLASERDDRYGGRAGQGSVYLVVEDPDAHSERARAAGATITTEVHDTDYGAREYAALDLDGNVWGFGTYRPAAEASEGAESASAPAQV